MRKSLWILLLLTAALINKVSAQQNSGVAISEIQLSDFDLIIEPNGKGLPLGSGNALVGKTVFDNQCQACHGALGEGGAGLVRLVGGDMHASGTPTKTVGSYWPYATTIFDYVRRAMPANAPKSLTNQEVYQVTAYLLFLNGIIGEEFVIDKNSLPQIVMPNRNGFIDSSDEL